MNIAIDVILLAIIVGCFLYGWRKGFVKTVLGLTSFLLAGIGASFLYGYPAEYVHNNILLPRLTAIIEESVLAGGPGMTLTELFNKKPDFFVDILNRYSDISEVERFYNSGEAVTVTDICEFMATPISRGVSNAVCFVLLFILLFAALAVLAFVLDKICKLPVLRSTNTFLGMVLGSVMGLLYAWLAASVIAGILPGLCAAYPDVFDSAAMENTVLLWFLYNFNPLTLIK